jgi:methylase of polypeptide subunit release factors
MFRLLDKEAKSILDVGCGDGRIMGSLRSRKRDIYAVAVDIFTPSLDKAKYKKSP